MRKPPRVSVGFVLGMCSLVADGTYNHADGRPTGDHAHNSSGSARGAPPTRERSSSATTTRVTGRIRRRRPSTRPQRPHVTVGQCERLVGGQHGRQHGPVDDARLVILDVHKDEAKMQPKERDAHRGNGGHSAFRIELCPAPRRCEICAVGVCVGAVVKCALGRASRAPV